MWTAGLLSIDPKDHPETPLPLYDQAWGDSLWSKRSMFTAQMREGKSRKNVKEVQISSLALSPILSTKARPQVLLQFLSLHKGSLEQLSSVIWCELGPGKPRRPREDVATSALWTMKLRFKAIQGQPPTPHRCSIHEGKVVGLPCNLLVSYSSF